MKVVFLILASDNFEHESDRVAQIETWAKGDTEDFSVIWLRGWDEDHYLLQGRDLFVPCKEGYDQILEKTILGIDFVSKEFNFDVLIRSNVSTYFDLPLLKSELLLHCYAGDFYGGYVDKTSGSYFGASKPFDYLSGTGIFMSKNYARLLLSLNLQDFAGIPDDIAISEFFRRQGLHRIRMKRNNLGSTNIFLPTFHIRAKSSTDSHLARKRMVLINNFFNSLSHSKRCISYVRLARNELQAFINHPESFSMYMRRNRVVASNYIRTLIERKFP